MLLNKLFLICCFFIVVSCSKEGEPIDQSSTTITVSTSNFTVSIDENSLSGQVIGTVSGTTNQGSVVFSITEQTPSGAFSINASSGELTIANETLFDFETNPMITGTIKVTNGNVFKNASVTINLNDITEANIFHGDVRFLTQQEVDDFGANLFTEINGHLSVGEQFNENWSIVDLTPLTSLTRVSSIYIGHNNLLESLNGLENLSTTLGNLAISTNANLINIEALSKITNVAGEFFIYRNPSITSLNGLNNISAIEESIRIIENNSLVNIDALNNINYVNGLHILITDNPSLISIDGLNNITTFIGGVEIHNNPSISEINILNEIEVIESIIIDDNTSLISINGFTNITHINRGIIIDGSDITNLDFLSNLISTGGEFHLLANSLLNSISGLNNLNSIESNFYILANENLQTLDGLESLNYVGEDLNINGNTALSDLCAIQNIVLSNGVQDALIIGNNAFNPTEQDIIDGNCSL